MSVGVPILPDLKYPQTSETVVRIINSSPNRSESFDPELVCEFASATAANSFVERLQKVQTLVCDLVQQHATTLSHRWLVDLLQENSSDQDAVNSIRLQPPTACPVQRRHN